MASLATVTILFCDVVGSTALLSRIGDGAADDVRRACFAAWRRALQARRGTEVKTQGDGLMASFTSAVDAVECAVALQHATAAAGGGAAGAGIALRVGISAGEAAYEEDDWFGTPVIEAARLCAAAAPGEILATDLVAALARNRSRRTWRDAGPYDLKGLPSPVNAVAFDWELEQPDRPPMPRALCASPASAFSFFVGRGAEVDRIGRAYKAVGEGTQRCYFIAGEPGIGKTSLAAEAAARAHDQGAAVLYGRCDQELAVAYQPFVEAFQGFVAACAPSQLEAFSPRNLAEVARVVPLLAERVPHQPPNAPSDPDAERRLLFEGIEGLLREISRQQPVVLVLDDLHWATRPTLLLLRHLLLAPEPVPMLILGTYRDTDLSRTHPLAEMLADLRRADAATKISLRGFGPGEGAAFVTAAAGHELDPGQEALAAAIHDVTAGHPLFLREVLSHLVECGVLYQRGGRWVTEMTDVDLERLGLPEGVRDAISRRLSALSETANEALRVAAVVGPMFELRVLERIPEVAEWGDRLLDALEEAEAVGLIVPGEIAGSYQFVHALVRQTLHDEVSAARRTRLHRRIAEAMEGLPDADDRVVALAHHFAQASVDGVADKAADYALAAGAHALQRLAREEAIAYALRGLEALDLAGIRDPHRRADLHLLFAVATEDRARGKQAVVAAAEHARAARDARRLAAAAVVFDDFTLLGREDPAAEPLMVEALAAAGADDLLRCKVLARLARYRFRALAGAGADLASEALAIARRIGDDEALIDALDARLTVLVASPDLAERQRLSDELTVVNKRVEAMETRDERHRARGDAFAWRSTQRRFQIDFGGLLTLQRGDRAAYDKLLAEYVSLPSSAFFRGRDVATALVALMEGRFDDAEPLILDGLAYQNQSIGALNNFIPQFILLRRDQGRWHEVRDAVAAGVTENPTLVAFEAGLALADAELGRVREAEARVRSLVDGDLERIPRDSVFPACLSFLSVAAAAIDDRRSAAVLLPHIEPYHGQLLILAGFIAVLGAADGFSARLLTTLERYDEAEERFIAALALESSVGAEALAVRTKVAFARMLHRRSLRDDVPRAMQLLDGAAATARRLGMGAVGAEAERLLGSAR